MEARVNLQPTGSATITVSRVGETDVPSHVLIRNQETNEYLGATGWRRALSPAPCEITYANGDLTIIVPAKAVSHFQPNMLLMVEDHDANISASLIWPKASTVASRAVPDVLEIGLTAALAEDMSTTATSIPPETSNAKPASNSLNEQTNRATSNTWLAGVVGMGIGAAIVLAGSWIQWEKRDQQLKSTQRALAALRATKNQTEDRLRAMQDGADPVNREASSYREDLAVARRDIVRLTDENIMLKDRSQSQTTTISDFVVKIADQGRQIEELQQRLGMRQDSDDAEEHDDTAAPTWLAVAMDSDGAAVSTRDNASRSEAVNSALLKCMNKGRDCKIIAVYEKMCVALSRPAEQGPRIENWGLGVDENWALAEQKSQSSCSSSSGSKCDVRFTVCSPETISKP